MLDAAAGTRPLEPVTTPVLVPRNTITLLYCRALAMAWRTDCAQKVRIIELKSSLGNTDEVIDLGCLAEAAEVSELADVTITLEYLDARGLFDAALCGPGAHAVQHAVGDDQARG